MPIALSPAEISNRAISLPAFPKIVNEIIQTLDDDNATLSALARHVEADPEITARVVSAANSAAVGGRAPGGLRNVHAAISLIGLARVRAIAVAVSLAEFARLSQMSSYFWEHSVAVAITAQELGRFTHVSPDYALVAGLLHDIGQLWMARFYPLEFQMVRNAANAGTAGIIEIEQHYFGLDHSQVGAILAREWHLPEAVIAAIAHHHAPEPAMSERLVPLIHVAEIFSNALDLTSRQDNQVTRLSEAACAAIGFDWEQDLNSLFGKIEARSEHACRIFR